MGTRALVILLLAGVAAAQDAKALRLAKRAKRIVDEVKPLWNRFVFEQDKLTDDELKKIIKEYDKAVDVFQQSQEIAETAAVNSTIVLLTRRATQARFALMSRVMRRKRAEEKPSPREKPPEETPEEPEDPEEEPDRPERTPEPTPEAEPEPPERPMHDGLPTLDEGPAARRRGAQAVRNFLMNQYLRNRKSSQLVTRCSVCNGSGRRKTNYLDENRRIVTVACPACRESGFHLDESTARRAFWLIHSPLHRNLDHNRAAFESKLDAWRNDPRKLPEFLSRVKILYLDYYGLWAEVTWQEHGRTPANRRFVRTVKRKLLRAGKRWFLFDPKVDKDFFSAE